MEGACQEGVPLAGAGPARWQYIPGFLVPERRKDMKKTTVLQELEHIRESTDGLLRAEDVVNFAKSEETALHSCFTWDDGEAAHQYRLLQARNLIRICVTSFPKEDERPMRVFVSLKSDRKNPGGGYRSMVEVLSDDDLRHQLLEQASMEFERWETKYRHLSELIEVFTAMDHVRDGWRATEYEQETTEAAI